MARTPACVGPEADVYLVRSVELVNTRRDRVEKRAELGCLIWRDVAERGAVAERLDEQRADSERADAVLDDPVVSLEHAPAGKLPASGYEIACEAVFVHVVLRLANGLALSCRQQRCR